MTVVSRPVGQSYLTLIGAINWDISIFEERFARPGREVPVRSVEEYSGGKGANVAVAAARILGPGRVALIGVLGDDEVSGMQLTGLREEGVSTEGIVIMKGRRSGRAYILVDSEGRKTIHTHFGANEEIQPRHVSSEPAAKALSRSSMVVVMDPPTQVALSAAKAAHDNGSRVVYSPGVRTQEGLRVLEGVVRVADTLVLDSNELKNLCRTNDEDSAMARLRKAFPGLTVVATLGHRGCTVARGGVTSWVEGVDLSRLGLKAVNSTGSGDAFLGVLASYMIRGRGVIEAVAWANLAGALKATRYETRGSPRLKKLESEMASLERLTLRPRGSRENRAS